MSPYARILAAVAFAAAIVDGYVLQPPLHGSPLALVFLTLAVGGPAALYLVLTRRLAHRPATFGLDPARPAFIVPGATRWPGLWSVLGMTAAGMALSADGRPGLVDGIVGVAAAGVAVGFPWLVRYSVTLTPEGVVAVSPAGRRQEAWDRLDGTLESLCVPSRKLHVDPEFLAGVVRHYAGQERYRGGIGTQQELDRLEAGGHGAASASAGDSRDARTAG